MAQSARLLYHHAHGASGVHSSGNTRTMAKHAEIPAENLAAARGRILASAASTTVEIASVATAVPRHVVNQEDAKFRAQKVYPQYARLEALYTNTGIDTRYSVEPVPWHLTTHTWEERTSSYQRNALELLETVASQSVADAGLALRDIDIIVTNTITGLAIPSLEARLMNRLGFRPDVERLPIFGLGCGGGVAGLARAARMAQARPGANVLFLTVDLCSLCLRVNDPSLAMFVSAALFGDGAAGVVLQSRAGEAGATTPGRARIGAQGEYFWSKTEHIMGWDIKNDGFGVVLSPELPTLMRERLGEALFPFLAREGLSLSDFDGFLLHPGGSKVLETAEDSLKLSREQIRYSWQVLKEYGNMSSATAMFVLKAALADNARGRYLLAAFGPGFSAYFVVLEL
jgi:alkylresorcinol/alkylpyrone synthase